MATRPEASQYWPGWEPVYHGKGQELCSHCAGRDPLHYGERCELDHLVLKNDEIKCHLIYIEYRESFSSY